MKNRIKIFSIIALGVSMSLSSCKDYLDINKNPNDATYANPELVLPGALTSTGSLIAVTLNDYGAWISGYQANAFGYSYVGSDVTTYNYTAASNTGVWTGVYGNLRNYQYVINQTDGQAKYILFNAVAKIMKAHHFQLLVDQYGDVPYSEGLLGAENVTPKYDKAEDVYQSLVKELDNSITTLKAHLNDDAVMKLSNADIVFKGDVLKWIKFANNIKLRILIRASESSIKTFVNSAFNTFSSEGFLIEDVIVNPGYSASSANMNPFWTNWHSSYTGTYTSTGKSRVPTPYIMGFYDGAKLSDSKRGKLVYRDMTKPLNQLGVEATSSAASAPTTNYPAWYTGTGTGVNASETQGILKSRIAGTPIMLASEVNFLLAEAALKGHVLSGSAQTNFDAGVKNSFIYLLKSGSTNALPSGVTSTTVDADVAAYKTANAASPNAYLTDYALATNDDQRLEAIITQKYIALNYITSLESWNEYRRTGYPKTDGSTDARKSFASVTSVSSRADKLPVRLLYPQSEINLNGNTPRGLSPFTSRIFWDAN